MLRYRADNLPGVGMGAFMPNLTRPGWASSVGLETATVVGFPGTDPVPIERTWNISPLGWEPHGFTKPSKCAPDEITPAVYLSHTRNMGPFAPRGAAAIRMSDQELPMPATPVAAAATPVFRPAAVGARDTSWAGSWPNVASGAS